MQHTYNWSTNESTDSSVMVNGKLRPMRVFLNDTEEVFLRVISCQVGDNGHVVHSVIKFAEQSPWQPVDEVVERADGRVRVEPWSLQMLKNLTQPLEDTPEIMIYFLINTLGDFLYMQRRLKGRGEMQHDVGVDDEQRAYLDQQLLVGTLRMRDGFRFANIAEYQTWFSWWSNWHKRLLTNDQWRTLDRLISTGLTKEDLKEWRPPGSWKDLQHAT